MCRIMSITNLSKVKNVDEMLLKVRDLVSENNQDGFGYAISYKNSVYSEKFLNPKDFNGIAKQSISSKMALDIFSDYSSLEEGEKGTRPLSLIAHGRTSTNHKGLVEYSHPFMKNGEAFIHNGVVDVWRKHSYKLSTKNDSEFLANVFWDKGLKGVSGVSGYYAFMNIEVGGKITIVKDTASLYGAYCEELDSYIFATLESMIIRFSEAFKLSITKVMSVNSMSYFKVLGGEVLETSGFKKTTTKVKTLSALERKAFKDYGSDYKAAHLVTEEAKDSVSLLEDTYDYWPSSWDDDDMPTYKGQKRRNK